MTGKQKTQKNTLITWGDVFNKYRSLGYDLSMCAHKADVKMKKQVKEFLGQGFKVNVEYIYPPIPTRDHDWCAYIDGEEEDGPYGYGRTRNEAILNLMEYWDE